MKKLLFIALFLSFGIVANAQDLLGTATSKGSDGYITGGYIKKGWGLYAGFKYNQDQVFNSQTGEFGSNMRVGIIRMLPSEKFMIGVGVQPEENATKPNVWAGYAPLKSEGLKLWIIGSLVGSKFSPGLGISYRLDKITF